MMKNLQPEHLLVVGFVGKMISCAQQGVWILYLVNGNGLLTFVSVPVTIY